MGIGGVEFFFLEDHRYPRAAHFHAQAFEVLDGGGLHRLGRLRSHTSAVGTPCKDREGGKPLPDAIVETMTMTGLEVESVENGQQAIDLALSVKFDLILMDCHMPEMDGFEATREIRRLPGWTDIPIVAVLGNHDEHVLRQRRNPSSAPGSSEHERVAVTWVVFSAEGERADSPSYSASGATASGTVHSR